MKEGQTSVRLVAQEVRVKLPEGIVEAHFVFRNDGPPVSVRMGFPEEGDGDFTLPKYSYFRNFRSYVDGKRVRVKRVVPKVRDSGYYVVWWVKRVHFTRGQTRSIVNRYRGGVGFVIGGPHFFRYILTTGRSWKGRIKHARAICNMGGLRNYSKLSFRPTGYRRVGKRVIWDFRDFEPQDDIEAEWFPGFVDVDINGEPVMSGVEWDWQNCGSVLPQRESSEVWVSTKTAAEWFSMRREVVQQNRRLRLTRGNLCVQVTVGLRRLSASSDQFYMPRPAYICEGHIMVALTPLVKSLGGKAHFDRKHKKMVIWLKPVAATSSVERKGT